MNLNTVSQTNQQMPQALKPGRQSLIELMNQLEDVWQHTDLILASLSVEERKQKHATGWMTFGDLPYHLAYFDRELVAEPIRLGKQLPEDKQQVFKTGREVDAWNLKRFSERPAGQSFEEDIALMRASREAIRKAVSGLNDSDLDAPSFFFLPGNGWRSIRFALSVSLMHTYAHMVRTRLRLKKQVALPTEATIHRVLNTLFGDIMPTLLNREEAQKAPFTAVMAIKGRGGGDWALRVKNASLVTGEGKPVDAGLVMTYKDADAFFRSTLNLQNPIIALITGNLRIKGINHMSRFGKLFAPPKPDQVVPIQA